MPIAELLTPNVIRAIFPKARADIIEAILTAAATELPKAGIEDAVGLAHLLGQIGVEAQGLVRLDENLNYTTPQRIVDVFGAKRSGGLAKAKTLVRDPERLGNTVYANMLGNGDFASGDGFRYRGSGLIQLTGKDNFRAAEALTGLPLVAEPERARQADSALEIALAYWVRRRISEVARGTGDDDVKAVTSRINPKLLHLSERQALFRKALKVLRTVEGAVPPAPPRRNFAAPGDMPLGFGGASEPAMGFGEAPMGFGADAMALVPGESRLSGPDWCREFPTRRDLDGLAEPFRSATRAFLLALTDAGASARVSATLRPPERAWLMHWAWAIAKQGLAPEMVQPRLGVPILWVHPKASDAVKAARAMVAGYGMVFQAALNGRHMDGLAVDMTLDWSGVLAIRSADGMMRRIDSQPRNGANRELWEVGRGYGLFKLPTDPPHWSSDGH